MHEVLISGPKIAYYIKIKNLLSKIEPSRFLGKLYRNNTLYFKTVMNQTDPVQFIELAKDDHHTSVIQIEPLNLNNNSLFVHFINNESIF